MVVVFEYFVKYIVDSVDLVFIFGDLFEYWIGDDIFDDDLFVVCMVVLMYMFLECGIVFYVMYGNCDFLFGWCFMKVVGVMLLFDFLLIMVFG